MFLSCEMTRYDDPVKKESGLLYSQTILLILIPPITVVFLFVYWVVASPHVACLRCFRPLRPSTVCDMNKLCKKRKKKRTQSQVPAIGSDGGLVSQIRIRKSSAASDEGQGMSTRDAWTYSMVLISYIMYPTLVRFPFELLQCRLVGTKYYLERDLEEECYVPGGRHETMLWVLAIPALLVYAVGMPLVSFSVLWKARGKLNTNKYRFRLGLLYSGYRKDRWWWECMVAVRKVFIISLASFGFNESIQVHVVLGLLLILLIFHYTFLPFDVSTIDGQILHRVERNSLVALIVMLWSGVVFIMSGDHMCESAFCRVIKNALVLVCIFVNVLLLMYGTWLFVYYWMKRNRVLEKIGSLHISKRIQSFSSRRMSADRSDSTASKEGDGNAQTADAELSLSMEKLAALQFAGQRKKISKKSKKFKKSTEKKANVEIEMQKIVMNPTLHFEESKEDIHVINPAMLCLERVD